MVEVLQKDILAGAKFLEIGRNIVNGIKEGISGAWDSLKSSIKEKVSSLVSEAKESLKIQSPSKVFASQVGQWIPAGIALGIEQGMPMLTSAINDMTGNMLSDNVQTTLDTVSTLNYVPASTNTSDGNAVVITNNIKVDGTQDPEAWTETFIRTLKREARMA